MSIYMYICCVYHTNNTNLGKSKMILCQKDTILYHNKIEFNVNVFLYSFSESLSYTNHNKLNKSMSICNIFDPEIHKKRNIKRAHSMIQKRNSMPIVLNSDMNKFIPPPPPILNKSHSLTENMLKKYKNENKLLNKKIFELENKHNIDDDCIEGKIDHEYKYKQFCDDLMQIKYNLNKYKLNDNKNKNIGKCNIFDFCLLKF